MEKELLKKAFDVLNDGIKMIEILSELHPDAATLFKNFFDNPLSFYQHINDEYKDKMLDEIIKRMDK